MKIFKYVVVIQFLIATYAMILFIITPIEKMVTIPLDLFYLLISLAWFGLIYITMFMARDWYKKYDVK
jgi:hypothetical protein